MNIQKLLLAAAIAAIASPAFAHGGGLNAEGCHNDRKNGGYHCHRSPAPPRASYSGAIQLAPRSNLSSRSSGTSYYANCSAARAAGAAPVKRGDPGYGSHLDRDNDGVACE